MFTDMEAFDVEMEELDALLKSDEFNSDVPTIEVKDPAMCWGCDAVAVADILELCDGCEAEHDELDRIDAEERADFEETHAEDYYGADDDGTLDFLEGHYDEY